MHKDNIKLGEMNKVFKCFRIKKRLYTNTLSRKLNGTTKHLEFGNLKPLIDSEYLREIEIVFIFEIL